MKIKSLFLGMLATAALVSCNNNAIEGEGPDNNSNVIEGIPIYTTMTLNLNPGNDVKPKRGAITYADVNSSAHEAQVKDAALYIYKRDASGTTPECAVFLSSLNSSVSPTPANGDYYTVTLKTTSGNKKIFVAANIKAHSTAVDMVAVTGLGIVSGDWTTTAVDLNKTLYSTSATAFSTTAPSSLSFATYIDPADGLIKNFAMEDIFGTGGGTYTGGSSYAPFMSNWDGTGTTANVTLLADVDSASSIPSDLNNPSPTYNASKNQFSIGVQRAYAKVSLKFGFGATTPNQPDVPVRPSNLAGKYYPAALNDDAEGRFFPWGTSPNAVWALGNITTAELPFQQYVNGVVQDPYYLNSDDSIIHVDKWFLHYDNTRVFPFSSSITTYPHPGITVVSTKTNILATTNNQNFTSDNSTTQASYNYAYATENARLNPVAQDHAPYVIFGGFYQPKNVLTSINRANVSSNAPVLGFNDAGLTGSEIPGSSVPGTAYKWVPSVGDSLYYIADDKIFIKGKDNLMAYYAWARKENPTAGDTWLATHQGQTITAAAVYTYNLGSGAEFGPAVVTAINDDIKDKKLYAFFEGQCFYRVFIQNATSVSSADRVAVLRNHIYDIKITSIKGPGIADPNQILIPNTPVLEQDTYVSATINVLPWHIVDQDAEADNQ
jgi:hypothetical protein